ncbi:PREDICTED: D-tyrosyl-tRNA(Tyr) deacylase 1 isoform X4 [Bactrocera latifrons]|uniref:D-tyrosyl-tRNA(Tyr) deacylase 1 isoform X4 n=1 Tax=Bactrocera latifrons TaxID=174628 RepID=UPI0008DC7FC4|nr:PREDICTED: D-tyrosyl-tRNA(Tyr) deacylase 1 isoform X4 [Bactrocera latifrons]
MKAIIQRVSAAKVTVGDELISSIGRGLCVLVGITHSDTEKDVEYMYFTQTACFTFIRRHGG